MSRAGRGVALATVLGLALATAACTGGRRAREAGTTTTASSRSLPPTTVTAPSGPAGEEPAVDLTADEHPRGGSARVGVTFAPDPTAPTLGGAAVRALVLPQLFAARPDGRWAPMLVAPGSDRTADDRTSATLRFRPGSAWSDGTPVTADDLRRSADGRFVAGVDGPATDGTLTIRFTQPLPGWRRLWSGADSIAPPAPGVWGGPFVVSATTPGLETVLARNPGWRGPGPFLDEVRLVLVPDATTQRQLLTGGQLDVIAPPAATVRTDELRAVPGATVAVAQRSGWWVGLLLNGDRLDDARRAALVASVPRDQFVDTLLQGEGVRLDGFASPEDAAWTAPAPTDTAALKSTTVDLVGTSEEPMTWLLHRAMQKAARAAGGTLELRQAEDDRVEGWLRERSYAAAIVPEYDAPVVCWTCRWGTVDAALAARADAGDAAAAVTLEGVLRDRMLVRPLWRSFTAVAWRDAGPTPPTPGAGRLGGVAANGYGLSAAWNAWLWWRA